MSKSNQWRCQVYFHRCLLHLGTFSDLEEAAASCYDRASYYVFKDKSKLNFPDETPDELEPDIAARIDAKLKEGGKTKVMAAAGDENKSMGSDSEGGEEEEGKVAKYPVAKRSSIVLVPPHSSPSKRSTGAAIC